MTYAAIESSADSGAPVELYLFEAAGTAWRYTSGDEPFEHGGETYSPRPFSRASVGQTAELAKGRLELKTPRDTPLVGDLIAAPQGHPMTLRILRRHRGDAEVATVWIGRVLGMALEQHEAQLICEPIFTSMRRIGLRRPAQRQCPHALYDAGCGLDKDDFAASATLTAVSGASLSATEFSAEADGWWVGGMVLMAGVYRMVVAHTGDTITLTSGVPGVAVDDVITIYPGCDHTPETCDSAKFANIDNYGGYPWFPIKNPFSGDSSY